MLPDGASAAERLAALPPAERERFVRGLAPAMLRRQPHLWPWWARAGQQPPTGAWKTWLILAGRGFGKTRAGAEWVRMQAEGDGRRRIALVAATMAEARAVMVEGESGLLAIAPPDNRPSFEPSLKRLRWNNGAQAFLYSAAEPESLRGPQHHCAWADEIGKWPHGVEAWDNLALGLRLGTGPQVVATTTPRPAALVRRLAGRALQPLAPAQIGATRRPDGTIRIGWVGRSRQGWAWLDGGDAAAADGERVRLTLRAGDRLLRTVACDAAPYDYAPAAQAADGVAAGTRLSVDLVAVGPRGLSAPVTIGFHA